MLELALGTGAVALAAACNSSTSSATSAPAKPAATTAPAKPAATTSPAAAGKASENVVVRLDLLPLSYPAPFYVAQDKGWYDEQGLTVEVGDAKGSGQAAQLVGTGNATFGYVEGGALVKAFATGLPSKSVALAFAKPPLGYAYTKDTGVKTPKDLEGKTYGAVPFSATFQFGPAFAEANGIDVSKVPGVNVEPGSSIQLAATMKVDSIDAAVGEEDFLLIKAGRDAATFGLAEYGLNDVGHAIVATTMTIQQKPEMVRRFLDATLPGQRLKKRNQGDALESFAKLNPDSDRDLAANQLKASAPLWSNPSGAQTEQEWQSTIGLIANQAGTDAEDERPVHQRPVAKAVAASDRGGWQRSQANRYGGGVPSGRGAA